MVGVSSRMEEAKSLLKKHWGQEKSFQGLQEQVISKLLAGESCFAIAPTGSGKSLMYQLPSMLFDGMTVVISPLIALMNDQVEALRKKGVPADCLHTQLEDGERSRVESSIVNGKCKLLYVAPEKLNNEIFMSMIARAGKISLVAVDEAHCVALWGTSFRPEYLKCARWVKEVKAERLLCLTATATEDEASDTGDAFGIKKENILRASSVRSNLAFKVVPVNNDDEKLSHILPILQKREGPVIVYATRQKDTEEVAATLRRCGISPVQHYHAGMSNRPEVEKQFADSSKMVLCATIAFGMGIDKSDVRSVIHWGLPKSPSSYVQEAGRAGRDGKDATCTLYLTEYDRNVLEGYCHADVPSDRGVRILCDLIFGQQLDDQEDCLVFKETELTGPTDIKPTTLSLLFAVLELDFHLIRATGACYDKYTIRMEHAHHAPEIFADQSPEGRALMRYQKPGGITLHTFIISDISSRSGISRSALAKKMKEWSRKYPLLQIKGEQVRKMYRITTEDGILPQPGSEEAEEIVERMLKTIEEREAADVARLHNLMSILTEKTCLTTALAEHFGETPGKACGKCSPCEAGYGISPAPSGAAAAPLPIDQAKFDMILEHVHFRDDPRLLARIGWGITSPRTKAWKGFVSTEVYNEIFESLVGTDFQELLAKFEKVCKAADYKNKSEPPKTPKSKSRTGASSGPGSQSSPTKRSSTGYPPNMSPTKMAKLSL